MTDQKLANITARKNGYGRATTIVFGDCEAPIVKSHVNFGYRKISNGEYVSNKYRSNFGWKNTYYQHAETEVMLPKKTDWLIRKSVWESFSMSGKLFERPSITVSNKGVFLDRGKKITREAAIKIYLKQGSNWSAEAYSKIIEFLPK